MRPTPDDPMVYCVRCGNHVRESKQGEGQHSKLDDNGTMVPCK